MVTEPGHEALSGSDPRLEDRVVALLSEHSGALAFNGLRRSLKVHPESLTRALRRLERYGRVAREDGGYRLLPNEESEEAGAEEEISSLPSAPADRWTEVAEVRLAHGIEREQVLGLLAGRWAGSLRWVGIYERPGEPLLVWSRNNGPGQVLLGIRQGALKVYADPAEAGALPDDLNEAARDLLVFALDRIRSFVAEPSPRGLNAFVLGSPPPSFGPN